MSLQTKAKIIERLNTGNENQIFIDPILDETQVGAIAIDLRLGCDFLVSVQTRKPSISLIKTDSFRDPAMFLQESRRDVGETFLLYPSQSVLATTLEYIGLPSDLYAKLLSRSSYNRLGLSMHTMFQPGFRGCISMELFNHSNNPIELIVGSRIVQAIFYRIDDPQDYYVEGQRRKYIGQVRPTSSRAAEDADIARLYSISQSARQD
jgi:dCTP deaminase